MTSNSYKISRKVLSVAPYILLTIMLGLSMLPLISMLGISFRTDETIWATRGIFPPEPSIEFYRRVLSDARIIRYFGNSFYVALITSAVSLVLALLGGYAMARFKRKVPGIRFFVLFILMIQMFPTIQMIIPLFLNFVQLGIMNTWYTLLIAYPAFTLPMSLMMMQSFIEGIPNDIEEAGRIDGCNRFQVITKLVLPIAKPGIASVMILAFNHAWNEFLIALLLIRTDGYRTIPIGLHNFVQENHTDWGAIMAASTLMVIPVLLFLNIRKRKKKKRLYKEVQIGYSQERPRK
ncbi:MAG: carbohydrate ABC transporter permease, partial [Oscillospiraceae bacterium]|nr:carbohydrate ABC transporter permease [Oscillospiraceae bacterium]